MPQVSDLFPSPTLRAADLNGVPQTARINNWHEAVFYGESCFVLDVNLGKGGAVLRLNATLARDIKAVLDQGEMDLWPGRTISIFPDQMKIRDRDTGEDKLVDVIRAMASPDDVKPDKAATATITTRRSGPDDSIPF